jgi:hypothetical protein
MIGFSIALNRLPHTCGGMGLALFVELEGYPAFANSVDPNPNHPNHQDKVHKEQLVSEVESQIII